MDLSSLISDARACGCTVTENAPMAAATTMRVGGPADILIDIPNADTARQILILCRRLCVPVMWIGNGSDLIVGDGGIRGAVLRLRGKTPVIRTDGERITCDAGTPLHGLCKEAKDRALTGLEFAYGIPGTVGGAIYMNAGAYGGEIAGVLESVTVLHVGQQPEDVSVLSLPTAALALGYRHSVFMEEGDYREDVLVKATFRLQKGEPAAIESRMKELLDKRRQKQPLEYPSAGSFFKRPEGYYAGALIEKAGMKGYRCGDAQVSEKHAGFVINRGHATAAELCQLCRDVQQAVERDSGVRLEPEVRFVGEFS